MAAANNAYSESSPLIVLVGEPGTDILGNEAFEEIDLVAMFRPVTKWAMEIPQAERTVEFLMKAYREALSGRPRPVILAIPQDYQTQQVTIEDVLKPPLSPSQRPSGKDKLNLWPKGVGARRNLIVEYLCAQRPPSHQLGYVLLRQKLRLYLPCA
ncbi:MAG: thiamine pyrophosphate-binding protein [Dehalococcoidia bacterium]|nr:thiamine pyrophosphate-binding protein [Dehalococcoidia bacterium]